MGKAINCILQDKIHKGVMDHKAKMQHRTTKNITVTDAVDDLLRKALKK